MKKHEVLRAGIITLCGQFNYGNRLQNHAVALLLRERGFKVETLVYPKPLSRRTKESLKRLLGRAGNPADVMSPDRKRRFERFDERMAFRRVSSCSMISDDYNLIAIGSDQVWNPYFSNLKITLAPSLPAHKILTVSPSFGVQELPKRLEKQYASALSRISDISVREPSGSILVEKMIGVPALVTIDPTLAIEPEIWREMSEAELNPREPYVFVYLLGKMDEEQKRAIEQACDVYRAKPVFLGTNRNSSSIDPGPSEFMSLIDGAACVVTDSFHACVFSAMFKTPLVVLRRNESRDSFSRLQNLIDMFNIDGAVYRGAVNRIESGALYKDFDHLLSIKQEVFFDHLDKGINRIINWEIN